MSENRIDGAIKAVGRDKKCKTSKNKGLLQKYRSEVKKAKRMVEGSGNK